MLPHPRMLRWIPALATVALLAPAASSARANAFDDIYPGYHRTGTIDACRWGAPVLDEALLEVPADVLAYAPEVYDAIFAARRAARSCPGQPPVAAPPPATGLPDGRALICRRVPTLLRHTLRGARYILALDGCAVKLTYSGRAKRPPSHVLTQSVAPGTPLHAGDTLSVTLG